MSIPPKYEDVVAKLDAALGRDTALREEIEMAKQVQETTDAIVTMVDWQRDHWIEKCGLLKQRLTVAEQRADELEGLLRETLESGEWFSSALEFQNRQGFELCAKIGAALKPAEDYNELDDDEDLEVFDDQ